MGATAQARDRDKFWRHKPAFHLVVGNDHRLLGIQHELILRSGAGRASAAFPHFIAQPTAGPEDDKALLAGQL